MLSDETKRHEYDEQMGFGKGGKGFMEQKMAKAREAAYSDDEFADLSEFQRRRRKGARTEEGYDARDFEGFKGQTDEEMQRKFWEDSAKHGARSRYEKNYTEEEMRKAFQ